MNFQKYALFVATPLLIVFGLISFSNAFTNFNKSGFAHGRVQILNKELLQTSIAQKPQVKSAIKLAELAENHHNDKAVSSVAWLLLELGLLTYCLVNLEQYIPSAPGND
jgi:hypothetical protein